MNILVLRSSANGAASISNRLADRLVERLRDDGAATIVERDLDRDPVPHVRHTALAGIGRQAPDHPDARRTRTLSDMLIDELTAADLLVIGSPMYNFSIASTLKSWFDHVLRAGCTFQYGPHGAEGLMVGTRAIVLVSRAGLYSGTTGADASTDHQLPYLRTLLAFIGITDVTFVIAEGLAFGEEQASQAIELAERQVDVIATTLAAPAA